jgi:hypothetical protein
MVTTSQDGEWVRTAETVWGESIGYPWRRSTDNDVIVDIFGHGMLWNYFRNVLASAGCDVEQSGFWLVELIGRRHREFVNKLFAGHMKTEILAVHSAVGLFGIRSCAGKRSGLRRRRRILLVFIVVGELFISSTPLTQMLIIQLATEFMMKCVSGQVDGGNDLLGRQGQVDPPICSSYSWWFVSLAWFYAVWSVDNVGFVLSSVENENTT